MKLKTRRIPRMELDGLFTMLVGIDPLVDGGPGGTDFSMITGDLELTQNMAEARWIFINTPGDDLIFQVDSVGDAILLLPEH